MEKVYKSYTFCNSFIRKFSIGIKKYPLEKKEKKECNKKNNRLIGIRIEVRCFVKNKIV